MLSLLKLYKLPCTLASPEDFAVLGIPTIVGFFLEGDYCTAVQSVWIPEAVLYCAGFLVSFSPLGTSSLHSVSAIALGETEGTSGMNEDCGQFIYLSG